MKKFLSLNFVFLALLSFSFLQAQQTKRIYLIGNSVTDGIGYDGFKNMALSQGNTHIWGRHMIPGAPLKMLWDNRAGGGFTAAPFGTPANAFPNYEWDVVTLQPFDRGIEGSDGDKTVMLNFAELIKDKSPDVQFYIYSRYPRKPSGATVFDADLWANLWNGTYTTGAQYNEVRKFFVDLYEAYNATNKSGLNKGALIIPVGDVMYALNGKAKAGGVPGINSAWDLYSDGIHVNNIGSYIIMGTFYSTIYKEDIRGTAVPYDYGAIDPELAAVIQQTIYDVVFTHPYSGTTVDDLIPVSSVELNKATLSMSVFNREQLIANVLPGNAAKKGVIWSSSNTNVAIVDQKGKVTSLAEGTATITVKTLDGDFTDECVVTVSGTTTGTTQSGTLAAWSFSGKNSTVNNNTTAASALSGVGYTLASVGEGLSVGNWDNSLAGTGQTTMDETSSIADGEYISFKVKAESGKLISVNNIKFTPTSQNNTRTFALFSSIKGFSPGNAIYSCSQIDWGTLYSADITGHNNLDEVEFRIYIYGHNNVYESAGLGNRSGDNFSVTGSVFTPANEAPSAPGNIRTVEVKDTYINFGWDESTDDYFVKGYNFYLGGIQKNNGLIEGTTFLLDGLSSGQECNIEVEAVDFFDKPSAKSSFSARSNRPPVAVVTPSVTSGKLPLTVSFGSGSSTDPDEEDGDYVLGFDWYLNGEILPDNGNTLEYTFTQRGEYEVSLVVMDSRGMRSIAADKVTVDVTAEKYAVTVNGGTTIPEIDEAYEGDVLVVKADEPAEGMVFDKWIGDGVEFEDIYSEETSFIMPAKPVYVKAEFITCIGVEKGDVEQTGLYPNPADNYIVVRGLQDSGFDIVNVAGTIVLSGIYNGESIDVSSLSPGWYLLRSGEKAFSFVKK